MTNKSRKEQGMIEKNHYKDGVENFKLKEQVWVEGEEHIATHYPKQFLIYKFSLWRTNIDQFTSKYF